ncbi:MAG: hypothetical protein WC412_03920 [Candidatus Omnitrophota bacterium]|jgi:hypothetical protein
MPISLIVLILLVLIAAPTIIILILHSGNPFRGQETSSKIHLKKNVILEVKVNSGRWRCPSCNDTNLEVKDDCGSCGQSVKKIL